MAERVMERPHATLVKFGYPVTLVHEYAHWAVLLRPKQATLGALVLACTEEATQFSAISAAASAELPQAIRDIETAARETFAYDRINYLMLMMIDPHVHFHVLPRYESPKNFNGQTFTDPGWPGPPDLAFGNESNAESMLTALRDAWPAA